MATTTATATSTQVHAHEEEDNSLWSWITTVDHKRIGKMYFFAATFFFFLGGIEALFIRTQLMFPRFGFISAQTYNEMFTMHATNMIFMAVMPMSAAFFNYLIPLQIGARDVAFPRMNSFSFWLFLFGALFMNSSLLLGTYPDGGWFGYANLTGAKYSPGASIDFWAVGLLILGTSSMAAGFNFITTIFNLRAPGMTMFRMPVFTWMALVVQFLLVLSLPMITIGLVLLVFDRNYGTNFYYPENGGDPLLWQHLFWLFGHPEVYILILPGFGLVSEVLPTFARKPLFGAPFVIFSGIAIGFIGFGVWSHHMFTTGLGAVADAAFSITTMIIAVPTAVKIFNWIATMWGGQLRYTVANLYAISLVGLFTVGGLSGVMHAAPPIDLQHQDSYFVVAHFHYVLVGGALMGLLSGIYFYVPKMFGFMLDEKLGMVAWFLTVVGMNVTFFPMHFLGAMGMARRTFTYDAGVGWEMWNMVATLGAYTLGIGLLLNVVNGVLSWRRGVVAPADPWDGATLEWSLPTPVPHYNFAKIPTVHSDRPFWDEKHEGGDAVSQAKIAGPGPHHPHMPYPSFWPVLNAFLQALFMAGFLLGRGNGQFDATAFQHQLMFQLPVAALYLLSCLAWIKEDPFASKGAAH